MDGDMNMKQGSLSLSFLFFILANQGSLVIAEFGWQEPKLVLGQWRRLQWRMGRSLYLTYITGVERGEGNATVGYRSWDDQRVKTIWRRIFIPRRNINGLTVLYTELGDNTPLIIT